VVDRVEIKAGLALHPFLQFGRDALLHRRIHVNRQEVIADVVLAHADRRKPYRLPLVTM
jgi:hypothetical protein